MNETNEPLHPHYRWGCLLRDQGQIDQAIDSFEKTLILHPNHRPSLEALVELFRKKRDWEKIAEYKRRIYEISTDSEERTRLMVEVHEANKMLGLVQPGEAEKTDNPLPKDGKKLTELLLYYEQTANWERLVDTIEELITIAPTTNHLARYYDSLGQIYRDKFEDPDRAVEYFYKALDADPRFLEPFDRISRLLTANKDWKGLERVYRKMLHLVKEKLPGNTKLEFSLAKDLGIIYRDRQKDYGSAIRAYKLALQSKPDDIETNQVLAELYEVTNSLTEAIEQQQEILAHDPTRVEPYRALYRLYYRQQAFDEAWCTCAALSFLRKATDEERTFFELHRPTDLLPIKNRLDNNLWINNLFHENAKDPIGKIFEMISPAALQAKYQMLASQRKLCPYLDRQFKQDANSTSIFARTFMWAADRLGIVNIPQLYVRGDLPQTMTYEVAFQPTILAGQYVSTKMSKQDLSFLCGKLLALYRGEFFIKTIFPTQLELEPLLYAGLRIGGAALPLPPDKEASVTPIIQALQPRMEPRHLQNLREVTKVILAPGAKPINIRQWIQGVEATSARAGLLLSGDLEIARKILRSEPTASGDVSPEEKMKALLIYSVSKEYFELRKHLGIGIGQLAPCR
jgi:golgin subfamily B member 1